MNGLEMLYHMLFVEPESFLWGLIMLGVIFALLSWVMDYGYSENRDKQ